MFTNKFKSLCKNSKKISMRKGVLVLLGLAPLFAQATDALKNTSLQQNTTDTFGSSSTFMIILFTVEIILGVVAYVTKSKNPMIFGSVLVLMIVVPVLMTLAQSNPFTA